MMPNTQNTTQKNYLMWFRRDLRLHDNTALTQLIESVNQANMNYEASNEKDQLPTIKALFIVTGEQWIANDMSVVQMDFLFRTLKQLAAALFKQLGIELHVLHCPTFDDCIEPVELFCLQHHITDVASNFEYEVNEMARDETITKRLASRHIRFIRYHDQCILPPQTVTTNDGDMYKVFTPFYKRWQSILETSPPVLYDVELYDNHNGKSSIIQSATDDKNALEQIGQRIDELQQQMLRLFLDNLAKQESQASQEFNKTDNIEAQLQWARTHYPAGESEACYRLDKFIAEDISNYDISRDQPALATTSELSAYLAIGALSPRLCYLQAKKALDSEVFSKVTKDIARWISELAWRDFYRHVIVDRPDIVKHNAYKKDTDGKVNWSYNSDDFGKWCQGKTGVPLVDAAMRCLNQTGFMHNRLRMVTAMFLTKDLLIDWRYGERYFMQNLIDGDFASNNGGWQWSASVGTDAAPYFRIMNPFSQAKTHDKDAIFIKTWLPELKDIPANILHDENKLRTALSAKGKFAHIDYPLPMVEHKQARLYAIEQFKS